MDQVLPVGWLVLTSFYAFGVFGWDKWRATRPGSRRVPEAHLLLASAAGGWLGALAGMMVFRHKTAKTSFKLKFALAFVIWAGLVYAVWIWGGRK